MGTDIHIHIEYKSRKKKGYRYGGKFLGERLYGVFEILAGVRSELPPLYPLRGLPGEVTKETLSNYHIDKCDSHHIGWLTTDEFGDCLEEAAIRYFNEAPNDWLRPYERIYEYMKEHEGYGERCRIIFWFDN